jgi:hypothetical protein
MHKTILSLVALTSLTHFSLLHAAPVGGISALESPVWVQRGNNRTALTPSSTLNAGDHVITGDSGRLEMQLWPDVSLQLSINSEIRLPGAAPADRPPELTVHRGKACIQYKSQSASADKFQLNIANTLVVAIHLYGQVCVRRQEGLSSVNLRDGSVQITHSVDPSIIILSEIGTEFRIADDGSSELLLPGPDESLTLEDEAPIITETQVAIPSTSKSAEPVDNKLSNTDGTTTLQSESVVDKNSSAYIYTVYLFSTRSKDVANEVNTKFQQAGHKSEILISGKDPSERYRIVVSGFNSLQSAREFSNSIVGKLGISDTWIGKEEKPDKPVAADDVVSKVTAVTEPAIEESKPAANENRSEYVYTVYLFSTRSEEVANQVNTKFQQAGHKSEILISGKEPSKRYRIVVSGFNSLQSAREFSNSIVGKLGISDTWIGKDRPTN